MTKSIKCAKVFSFQLFSTHTRNTHTHTLSLPSLSLSPDPCFPVPNASCPQRFIGVGVGIGIGVDFPLVLSIPIPIPTPPPIKFQGFPIKLLFPCPQRFLLNQRRQARLNLFEPLTPLSPHTHPHTLFPCPQEPPCSP